MVFNNHTARVLQLVKYIPIWKKLEFSITGFKILISNLVRKEPVHQLQGVGHPVFSQKQAISTHKWA